MADVEFSEEIRDRILYHWSELGDRPKIIWTRLQEEGFNVDLNTVQALMQCEDEEATGSGTIAEHENEDSRNARASVSPYPEGNSPASITDSPNSVRSHSRRGKNREGKTVFPQNRRTKLTPDVLNLIEKILDTDAGIYSLAALQAALLVKGVKISKTTTFRALEKLGRSIVVKKMNFPNRIDVVPVPEHLVKNTHFDTNPKYGVRSTTFTQEGKRRQHTLTIREMESLGSQPQLSKDDQEPVPTTTMTVPTSSSTSVSASSGARMETGTSAPILVLPPKKAATATSSSLKLVLGQGRTTTYTSAPLDDEPVNEQGDDEEGTKPDEMETQESVRSQSPADKPAVLKVKQEVVEEEEEEDYEIKVDDDYELNVEAELPPRRYEERPGSQEQPEDLVIRRGGPRARDRMPPAMSSWMERAQDNDEEAAIMEARAISRRRLSQPRDQSLIGSDEEFDSDPEADVIPKRPSSLGRSSVGSAHSAHSAHSASSRATHFSHGFSKTPEDMARSGRSSSTLTSQSGSSGGSGGMERSRRSPMTSSATNAAMAARMAHFPLTFHRSQMCNAAAMAGRLAHGIMPEMGAPFHVGQRRLPLSAGRGGVKQPFMSKFQRNMIGMRRGMASGIPRRMQRMSPGFPHGIPLHRYQKMLRMHHAMGKAMRGMHHFGRGQGRGRCHGEPSGRHMRRMNESHDRTSPQHSPGNFSGDEISPELEIDPPETYGEFAERIFSSNRNQRQMDTSTESSGTEKWMEDISHRLEVIENQLQVIMEHLPFMGGAEMQSVSSDPGGAGSEVDSGLQEDSGAGPGGAGDDRSGGGNMENGGERGGHGERSSENGGEGAGEKCEGGDKGGRKRSDSSGSTAGSSSHGAATGAPSGRERSGGRHLATKRPYPGAKETGSRCGDSRLGSRPGGSGLPGSKGRLNQERPIQDDGVMIIDDQSQEGQFQDNLSEFGAMQNMNQSQTDVRIQMVMQDSRWDEMTPYAGAPRLAIALARYCIFGTKILIRSSVTGRNSKHPLDFAGMRKIKHLLFQKYGARCSLVEFEVIWKTSRESISQLCKRLRRKFNVAGLGQPGHDDFMPMDEFMVGCPLLA
ncbi:uncharacterized protein LOC129282834 [Lytechinus pictus]|uniref:uncharacterized protein LOC129282834 n=1 Tax=Lytechinus pictus TaxID=7653 RepID=UPI0030B9EAC8